MLFSEMLVFKLKKNSLHTSITGTVGIFWESINGELNKDLL